MEIEIKDANNNIASTFFIPLEIECSSKENVTSDNTPNYIEEIDNAIHNFNNNSLQLLKDIRQEGTEAINNINENYATIVNDVNSILNNYENLQQSVSNQISTAVGNITQFKILVVEKLPSSNIDNHTIYFLKKTVEGENNLYDEYMYISNKWEHIGSTDIDLSNYITQEIHAKTIKIRQELVELTATVNANTNYTMPIKYCVRKQFT